MRRVAISPGAPGLLIIALDIFGEIAVNNKADVIDDLEVPETFSDTSPAAETQRIASGVDIVDCINRAAFRRRTTFDPSGMRCSSKTVGSHH